MTRITHSFSQAKPAWSQPAGLSQRITDYISIKTNLQRNNRVADGLSALGYILAMMVSNGKVRGKQLELLLRAS